MTTLTFYDGTPNASLELGDLIYHISNPTLNYDGSRFTTGDGTSGVSTHVIVGTVASISVYDVDDSTLTSQTKEPYHFKIFVNEVSTYTNSLNPAGGDYIFFVKNNYVEKSSVLGYYNSITMRNDSTEKAELFAVSCEIFPSSK